MLSAAKDSYLPFPQPNYTAFRLKGQRFSPVKQSLPPPAALKKSTTVLFIKVPP
jgi:hypothetical protein